MFPQLSRGKTVDLLIGCDNIELHTSIQEIHGHASEPIAWLTPLGWTCVGRVNPNSVAGLLQDCQNPATNKTKQNTDHYV